MDNYAYQPDGNSGPFAITGYAPRKAPNDYLVEVNSRSKILKKPVFYKGLAALFFLLAIIFLITLIVIITSDRRKSLLICTTDECLRTATNLKLSLDLNVDPCENFYQFTCGKWSEEHPNHGWWSSFSSFTTITEKVAISSLKALTNDIRQSDEPKALQKSRDFYKACMDREAQDRLGLTTMYPYIKRLNLPITPTFLTTPEADKIKYMFDWMKTETTIKQLLMMDVFIGATVDANIFNGSENVIYIGVPYQKCPLPSPFKARKVNADGTVNIENTTNSEGEEAYKQKAREIYANVIKYVIKQIALNETDKELPDAVLEDAAKVILDISDTIDGLITNFTDLDATEDDTFSISISKLQSETDSVLAVPQSWLWKSYFKYLFTGTNVTVDHERDLLFVTDLDLQYLKKVISYLYSTPYINIELYMWWKSVYAMIINTSSDIVEYIAKETSFFSTSSGTVARSRSLECALLANNYMGYAVSYALADKSFLNTTKPKVERMVKELKNAFVSHVNSITWMDAATKRVTLEKSKEMITFIGYPDWLFEEGELDKYYEDVEVTPDTYLDNMISQIMSYSIKKLKALREKHERDWHSEPIEVNAFNSFSDNAINVPMAILDFPMYNLGLEVLNYGSIGSILGHELTHGFDNTGRKHDKYGNFVQWWTNKTIDRFENLTQCFIKQYDNFTVEGVEGHVKGKFTLGENLADNGGINQAYAAYKNRVKHYGEEPSLPGFENYSNYQLFFIAYGSIWCETNSIADLKDQLEYDEHCPNSVRVLGTLQNSDDFARAFKCPEGSYMNPKTKCKIW